MLSEQKSRKLAQEKQSKIKSWLISEVMAVSTRKVRGISGGMTSVALEPLFWSAIEKVSSQSGQTWRQWAESRISTAPEGITNRASWLRTQVLKELMA